MWKPGTHVANWIHMTSYLDVFDCWQSISFHEFLEAYHGFQDQVVVPLQVILIHLGQKKLSG